MSVLTGVVGSNAQLAEDPVGLPPPVVLGLRVARLAVVPVQVRVQSVVAALLLRPEGSTSGGYTLFIYLMLYCTQ